MTDAPKIDTQAPETLWLHHHAEAIGDKPERWWEYQDYIRADVAAAREAAAWIAGRDAAKGDVQDWGRLFVSNGDDVTSDVIYDLEHLTPPTDPAALDRLIAERVREAYFAGHRTARAWHDDVLSVEDGFANFIAARGSKEGQS